MRTKAEYGKISESRVVAGNVGRVLAAGGAVVWPATSFKETRATRAERAERAITATNYANKRKRIGGEWRSSSRTKIERKKDVACRLLLRIYSYSSICGLLHHWIAITYLIEYHNDTHGAVIVLLHEMTHALSV